LEDQPANVQRFYRRWKLSGLQCWRHGRDFFLRLKFSRQIMAKLQYPFHHYAILKVRQSCIICIPLLVMLITKIFKVSFFNRTYYILFRNLFIFQCSMNILNTYSGSKSLDGFARSNTVYLFDRNINICILYKMYVSLY